MLDVNAQTMTSSCSLNLGFDTIRAGLTFLPERSEYGKGTRTIDF